MYNMESKELKKFENRLLVANLINDVLVSKITVQEALSKFPKDKDDINIKCAFDALMHREADEDLRKSVKGYAQIQDNFLSDIAEAFKQNKTLPQNIINQYLKYHTDDIISDGDDNFKTFMQKVKRIINF